MTMMTTMMTAEEDVDTTVEGVVDVAVIIGVQDSRTF
jgi:hypothetical protein